MNQNYPTCGIRAPRIRRFIPALLGMGAAAVLAFGPLPLAAASHGDDDDERNPGGSMMLKMDTDKNGSISANEFQAKHAARISDADANKDGAVTYEEFKAHASARMDEKMKRRFDQHDTDGDGKLTETEAKTHAAAMFKKMDKNGDGALTADEMHHGHMGNREHHKGSK